MPLLDVHRLGGDTRERIVTMQGAASAAYGLWIAGLSDAGAGYCMQRRRPLHDHLLVCDEGQGEVWLDGAFVPCSMGQAYLSPAGRPMAFRTRGRQRWSFAWLYYERRPGRPATVTASGAVLVPTDPWPIHTALQGLYRESIGAAQASVMDRWVELLQTAVVRTVRPVAWASQLQRLWEAVDARLAVGWTLPRLADVAGMSREALRLACHEQFGRPPIAQVAHLRMRRAASLLVTTPYTLEGIARSVGYAAAPALCTAFRRAYGVSPGAYRGDGVVSDGAKPGI